VNAISIADVPEAEKLRGGEAPLTNTPEVVPPASCFCGLMRRILGETKDGRKILGPREEHPYKAGTCPSRGEPGVVVERVAIPDPNLARATARGLKAPRSITESRKG
jgi:hypothetical protein